jgi:hypothetical protein
MKTSTTPAAKKPSPIRTESSFTPFDELTRPTVSTEEAAHYLNRKQQTLRIWATYQPKGSITPIRVMGRLAWRVSDIRELLNGGK